jgi:cell division transport system permease protein
MILPANLFTPAVQRHKLGLSVSILMTAFVFLVTLGLAVQVALLRVPTGLQQAQDRLFHIQVSGSGQQDSSAAARQIVSYLQSRPDVTATQVLDEQATRGLLQGVLADGTTGDLPIPVLVEAQFSSDSAMTSESLQRNLTAITPDLRVMPSVGKDSAAGEMVRKLALVAGFVSLVTLLALIVAFSLISKLVIAMQTPTIELLHLLGGTDEAIANDIVGLMQRMALPATFLGFVLAACTLAALGLTAHLPFIQILLSPANMVVMVLALVLAPLIALATAQWASRAALVAKLRLMP